MDFTSDKIRVLCDKLLKLSETELFGIDNFEIAPCDYKNDKNAPDKNTKFVPYKNGDRICGLDKHFWLKTSFKTPKRIDGKELYFSLCTGREGNWDANNLQCLVYLNGEIVQGLNTNHTRILLSFDTQYDVLIYFYAGMIDASVEITSSLKLVDTKILQLYYDVHVRYDTALCFDKNDDNYITIMRYLDRTLRRVNFLVPLYYFLKGGCTLCVKCTL